MTAARPVPIARIAFNPETRCYGFTFRFQDRPVHYAIDTFTTLEWAKRWADPWNERIWEETSDADESALLISTAYKERSVAHRSSGDVNGLSASRTVPDDPHTANSPDCGS